MHGDGDAVLLSVPINIVIMTRIGRQQHMELGANAYNDKFLLSGAMDAHFIVVLHCVHVGSLTFCAKYRLSTYHNNHVTREYKY